MKTSIIVDSGCDINVAEFNTEDCKIQHIPLNLQIGEKVYLDDDNLDIDEYLAHMESSETAVKSSAPSPNLFFEAYKTAENIFGVTLSSKLSATYQSAMTAKDMYTEEYGNKFIHIFDSFAAAIGEGVIAMKIAELVKEGVSNEEIIKRVDKFIEGMGTYFILDKFDNLVKTGRVKPYVAKAASFLNVKPICCAENGEVKMLDKARGFNKALVKMVQIIKENTPDIENRVVGITHVRALEKATALKEEILKHLNPKAVLIQESRGVSTTYANRGGVIVAL